MPLITPANGFGRIYQQVAKAGVTITCGNQHVLGNWATLLDPLSYDLFGVHLQAWGVSSNGADTRMLMNIGVAPTGGGSEQVVIPYLDVGHAFVTGIGRQYFFPLYVPAGKAMRAQAQGFVAADTVLVVASAYELPPHGYAEDAPQEWTQYGADSASSQGVAVTSGAGSYGTEVQITASTSRDHRWFHVGIDWGSNTTISLGTYRVRLSKDTGGTEVIGIWDFVALSNNEDINGPYPCFPSCFPLPAGSPLYIDVDGAAAEAMTAMVYAY